MRRPDAVPSRTDAGGRTVQKETLEGPLTVAALGAYRAAVASLASEIGHCVGPEHADEAIGILTRGLVGDELGAVLGRLPHGVDGAVAALATEINDYRPSHRSAATNLNALVRIWLLSQIDAVWWGRSPMFETDESVVTSPALVRLDSLRRRGALRFQFTSQPKGWPGRLVKGARRRVWPTGTPRTAGLRFELARPEAVVLINQLAGEFAAASKTGTPPLWVTSTVRSVEHQRHLSSLGYSALLPSAHCAGYATDLELRWFESYGEDHTLAAVLLEHQSSGEINVIDEGQAWHVCISPDTVHDLRSRYRALVTR